MNDMVKPNKVEKKVLELIQKAMEHQAYMSRVGYRDMEEEGLRWLEFMVKQGELRLK